MREARSRLRRRGDQLLAWFARKWRRFLERRGYRFEAEPQEPPDVVFHFLEPGQKLRAFRRQSKATFVVGILVEEDLPGQHKEVQRILYPLLVRSLSNVLVGIQPPITPEIPLWRAWFVTPELGTYDTAHSKVYPFMSAVYKRLRPIISSTLVIDNLFQPDLPRALWEGNERTQALREAGRRLDALGLLPAPFPLEELLTPAEMRHLQRLYGIGGLSYGNLSVREPHLGFWMSASGVDKSRLSTVGRDILLIRGYDEARQAMTISTRPDIPPRRASVDAIEHWMIYREHPEVNAIVHVHGWMEGVPITRFNYPCGTLELAQAVAELVRASPNRAQAIVGLKNHGLTITGRSLEEIFERIEGKISKYVPMS